jgi:hypothetical protein
MLTFFAWSAGNAQSNQGAIIGTVTDPTGSTVSDASVTAKNSETGSTYTATTTSAGNYNIRNVNIGPYDITVTAPGFSAATQKGAVVQVATTTTVNVALKVGAATDTVTVSADVPMVETESSDIGNVVTTKQILDLPLALGGVGALRSPEAFVFLTPGVVGPGTANGNGGVFESKISGGQNYATEILLDGASTSRSENGSSFDEAGPSVEALGEFKVITSTLPAEFGRTTGGIETFTTKAGTNAYHGHLYDIFRNEDLNANTWFNNLQLSHTTGAARSNFQRPLDRRNDYGGTLGGPVIIPKFYNGKNKTFFFFSWEQFRQTQGGITTSTVPTVAQRNGDFSATEDLSSNLGTNPCDGSIIHVGQVFDPATTRSVNGTLCRTAFPGNMIQSTRFDQIGLNILSFYPLPLNSATVNNYALSASFPILNTTMTIRGDQNIGTAQKVYFTYSSRQNVRQTGYANGNNQFNNAAGAARDQVFTTHFIRAGHDYTISPTLLNHFNVGYNRTNSINVGGATRFGGGDWNTKLGIAGAPPSRTFPNIAVFEKATSPIGDNVDGDTIDNGLRFNDNVSLVHGRHTFQFGADFRYQQYSPLNHQGASGAINFARAETAATVLSNGQSGNAIASLLLGVPDFGTLTQYASQPKWLSHYFALYAQDNFKVTPTLTLNLGLRWEVDTPRRESRGDTSNLSLTAPNPGAGGLPGALVFAGKGAGRSGNVGETWASTWYKDVAPRVGFAWVPQIYDGKTSIRGGYGIYYGFLLYADFGADLRQGFTAIPQFRNLDSFSPAFNIDTGYPNYPHAPNFDPAQVNNSGGVIYVDPSYGRPAMVQNWSLEVQQELATDLIFSLGYVGEHATHLRSNFNGIDNLNPSFFALGPLLSASSNSPQAIAAGIKSPYPGFVGTVAQSLRPFPQYFGLNTDCCLESNGQSNFNALEASLNRRFHNGLNLLISYTWSKTLTDADSALPFFATLAGGGSPQNTFDKRGEKSISNQDVPQNLVVSYLYELPTGKNKKFLNKGGISNVVFGGWEISGVQRYLSGQPISICCATGIPGYGNSIRYDRVSGQNLASAAKQAGKINAAAPAGSPENQYFNFAAFSDPNAPARIQAGGAYRFGTFPRTTGEIRSYKYLNEDLNINKRIHFTETSDIYLQTTFLDVFNRHVFGRPDTSGINNPSVFGFTNPSNTLNGPRNIQFLLKIEF